MVVEAEAYQAQVRRILQSKAFRTSEVHRNLLTYLSEKSLSGDADSLKEYTVGLDVFQKPDSYDPRQESVVRMHMARLRQKLGEYYRTEGLEDPVIVDLPKGAFKVTFEPRPIVIEPELQPESATSSPVASPASKRTFVLLAGLLIAAIACATYFGVRLSQTQRKESLALPTTWTPELRELWAPLLSPDRPLVVCLATQEASNLTGLSTANGAFLLGQFLADRKQNVYLTGSDELSMPEISMGNVVFLGPMTASRQLKALPVHEELTLEANGIRNLHPAKGEAAFFSDPHGKAGDIQESYALITHAPGVNAKGDVLYLSGNHISSVTAGVEAFTDPVLARKMVTGMRKPDGKLPRYYQVVLKVRSMDDTPLEIEFVLSKELMAASH
jgi:hypothetical protein